MKPIVAVRRTPSKDSKMLCVARSQMIEYTPYYKDKN